MLFGCQKTASLSNSADSSTQDQGAAGSTPSSGHTVTIDEAAGGGVNQTALKKARALSASGVSSVNSAQKQGYGTGDDSGN